MKNSQVITLGTFVLILAAVLAVVLVINNNSNSVLDTEQRANNQKETAKEEAEPLVEEEVVEGTKGITLNYDGMADLVDIFGGGASGRAYYGFSEENLYQVYAEFQNLKPLEDDFFYEGWVVRKEPFAFKSTGKLSVVDGVQVNNFESELDYSSYESYILTLEPDDNDPGPAEHVLEGDFITVQQDIDKKLKFV